jgi:hypothetical protein
MDNCVSCNLVICVFRACCYVEEDNVFFGFGKYYYFFDWVLE